MEYIANGDLGRYIKENRAKAKADGRAITEQILRGLVVLHEREICHRDLKPQVMYHSIVGVNPENNHTNNSKEHPHCVSLSHTCQNHRFRNFKTRHRHILTYQLWYHGLSRARAAWIASQESQAWAVLQQCG